MSTHSVDNGDPMEPGELDMDVQEVREMPKISFGDWRPKDTRGQTKLNSTVRTHPLIKYQSIPVKNTDIIIDTHANSSLNHRPTVRPAAPTSGKQRVAGSVRYNSGHDRPAQPVKFTARDTARDTGTVNPPTIGVETGKTLSKPTHFNPNCKN